MKLVAKFVENNEVIGYKLMDTSEFALVPRALYLQDKIEGLIAEGYRYIDYDPNHILKPDGKAITELPSVDVTAEVKQELALTRRGAANALSDAQACKYYSHELSDTLADDSFITFKSGSSTGYIINTREELRSYVNIMKTLRDKQQTVYPIIPLNAIVNPECWFSPEEIITHKDEGLYQEAMDLRSWVSWEDFEATREFLVKEGVLVSTAYDAASILRAWYAWGPDLLKGQYTTVKYIPKQVYPIDTFTMDFRPRDNNEGCNTINSGNKMECICAYDAVNQTLVNPYNQKVDLKGIISLRNSDRWLPLCCSDERLLKLRRSDGSDGRYQAVKGTYRIPYDVFYCDIICDGLRYSYKASNTEIRLVYGKSAYDKGSSMGIELPLTSERVPLLAIRSKDDYEKYSIALLQGLALTKKNSVVPIGDSNAKYLREYGANTLCMIERFAADSSKDLILPDVFKPWVDMIDLKSCLKFYTKPIPDYILEEFGLSRYCSYAEYDEDDADAVKPGALTKRQFLEEAEYDECYIKCIDMAEGQYEGEIPEWAKTYTPMVLGKAKETLTECKNRVKNEILMLQYKGVVADPLTYYGVIKFVEDVLSMSGAFGNLSEGFEIDSKSDTKTCMEMVKSMVDTIIGIDATVDEFVECTEHLDNFVSIDKIVRKRQAAAVGYVRDAATECATMFGSNTGYWAFVNRVFREAANVPVSQQRPYMVELLMLTNNPRDVVSTVRHAFGQLVTVEDAKELIPDLDYDQKFKYSGLTVTTREKLAAGLASKIAATLAFKTILNVLSGKCDVNQPYVTSLKLTDEVSTRQFVVEPDVLRVIAELGVEKFKVWMTLDQLCELQFSKGDTLQYNIAIVNADVTPWSVTPKPGFVIGSYPFFINYTDVNALTDGKYDNNALLAIANSKCKKLPNMVSIIHDRKKFFTKACADINTASTDPADDDGLVSPEDLSDPSFYWNNISRIDLAESPQMYWKRFLYYTRKAREEGKELVRIPLRQDILYGEIGRSLGFDVFQTNVYGIPEKSVKFDFDVESLSPAGLIAADSAVVKGIRPLNGGTLYLEDMGQLVKVVRSKELDALYNRGCLVNKQGVLIDREWILKNGVTINNRVYLKLHNGIYFIEGIL